MSFGQLKQIWNIVRLRGGPEDLPYSHAWLAALALLHVLTNLLLSGDRIFQWNSLVIAAVNTLFTISFIFVLLQWTKKSPRFVQTLSALFAAEILINMSGALLLLVFQVPALEGLVAVLFLFLIIWSGVVAAHIFHRALDTTMLWGVALALLYIFLAYHIFQVVSAAGSEAL